MHKLPALYINEMTKIWRRVSVIIIVALTVAGIPLLGGLMKFTEMRQDSARTQAQQSMTLEKDNLQAQLDSLKTQLEDIRTKEKSASADTLASLKTQETDLQGQVDQLQFKLDNGVYGTGAGFRETAVAQLSEYQQQAAQLDAIPAALLTDAQKKQAQRYHDYADRLKKAVQQNDFTAYTAVANDIVSDSEDYSADEKKLYVELNNLKLRLGLTGQGEQATDQLQSVFSALETGRLSLLKNIDQTTGSAKPLTADNRQQIVNLNAVRLYELEHKSYPSTNDMGTTAMSSMLSIGTFMIALLMMILAGGIVSQEMATGSIKSLIIAPVRRWKILLAKLLALLTMCVVTGLIVYGVSVVSHGILFGFTSGAPYVYATGGTVHAIGYYPYLFCRLFVDFTQVLVYMTLAMMLSVITRNTAASVGISLAVYFGGSIANSFLLLFAKGLWVRFIPFGNFDLTARVFPFDSLLQTAANQSVAIVGKVFTVPLTFSLCYTAVVLLLMLYTAFDSFCRRDIR